jgi:hypothetical protein
MRNSRRTALRMRWVGDELSMLGVKMELSFGGVRAAIREDSR